MIRYHLKIGYTNWIVDPTDNININGIFQPVTITRDKANMELKAIFVCVRIGYWGKGYSANAAKRNAGILNTQDEKLHPYKVYAAILDELNSAELVNLYKCITVPDGIPEYYKDERTAEDTKMIHEKHLGWLLVEHNY